MSMDRIVDKAKATLSQDTSTTAELSGAGVFWVVVLTAIATPLFLQASRVFFSYTIFGAGGFPLPAFIFSMLTAILGVGVGGVLIRVIGIRGTLLFAVAGLAFSRLVIQFLDEPDVRIVSGAVAIATWGWLILTLLVTRRDGAAVGLVFGLGLDLALEISLYPIGLPWMPDSTDHILTVALTGIMVLAAIAAIPSVTRSWVTGSPITLLVIGPGLLLYHLVIGSIGLAQANADVQFATAAPLLAGGMILGIIATIGLAGWFDKDSANVRYWMVVVGVIAGALALWRAWSGGLFAPLGFVIIAIVGTGMIAYMLLPDEPAATTRRVSSAAAWLTIGNVLQATLFLTYFIVGNVDVAVWLGFVVLAASALARRAARSVLSQPGKLFAVPAILVIWLVLASVLRGYTWSTPEPGPPLNETVTVMTFNIQTGFTAYDEFSLEAIADTVEQVNPDIVILQEVARGWPFTTGVDQAAWLSKRLDMPFVFGSSNAVRLWSVTILSSAPLSEIERDEFSVPRFDHGIVIALVEAGHYRDPWVFGTHFAAPRGAQQARVREARELLDTWNQRRPAIVGGDFNAGPDTPAMEVLQESGLVDVGEQFGSTAPTFRGNRRIDHILVTQGLEVVDVYVVDTQASDHRPVVATIRLDRETGNSIPDRSTEGARQ